MTIIRQNNGELYAALLDRFFRPASNIEKVDTRYGEALEIHPEIVGVNYPGEMVPFVSGRKPNYFGMLAESLWILTDTDDAELVSVWNSGLKNYADLSQSGRLLMHGAYGKRLAPHVNRVIAKLRDDRDTRHAIVNIYDNDDLYVKTNDVPCNVQVMFKIRDDALDMTVVNRSNDLLWGLNTVNIPQFAFLQTTVANAVGIDVGKQFHMIDSLHMYVAHPPQEKLLLRMEKQRNSYDFFSFYDKVLAYPHGNRMFVRSYEPSTLTSYMYAWSEGFRTIFEQQRSLRSASGFMLVAELLLTSYPKYRNQNFSNEAMLTILSGDLLSDDFIDCFQRYEDNPAQYPLDWVAACLSVFCKKMEDADRIAEILYELVEVHGISYYRWGIEKFRDYLVGDLDA